MTLDTFLTPKEQVSKRKDLCQVTYWLRNANKYLITVRTLFGSVDNSDLTCAMLVITSSGSATVSK